MSQAASRGKRLLHLALKKKDEDPPRKKKRKIAPLAPPSQRHKPNLLELYDTGQWDKLCPILNKQLLTTSKDLQRPVSNDDSSTICVPLYPLHDINDSSSSCELLQASSCRSLVSGYNCVQGQANVLPHDKPHSDSTTNSSSQISDFTDKPHSDLTDNNMICVPIYPLHDINVSSSSCEQLQASSCRSLVSDYNCVQGQANVLPHDKPHSDSTTNSSSQISDSNDKPHSDLTDNNMICVPIYPLHDINDYSSSCELLQASSCRSLVSDYNCVQGQANVLPHDKPHIDSTKNSSSQISDFTDKPHSDLTDNIKKLHDINDSSSCRSLVSDYNCVQGQANVLPHDKPHSDSTTNSSSQISDSNDKPHSDLTDNNMICVPIYPLHDINDSSSCEQLQASSCRSLVSDYNCVQGQANVLPHDKPHSDSTTNSSSQISDSNDKPHSDLTDNNMICVPIYPLHDINDYSSSCELLQASSCRSLVSDYNCVQGQANVLPHDKPHSDSTTNSSSQISDSNDKPHSDLTDNNMICVPIYPLHDINDYSSSCELLQASSCRSLVSGYNCVQGQANVLPHDKPHSDSTTNSSSQISDFTDKPHSDLTDNNMICVPIYPLHDINVSSSSCEQLQASSCRSLVSDYNCVQGQANVLPHDKPHSDSTTNSSSQISDSNDKPHSDLTDNNMICVPIYPLHDINDSSSCEQLQASSCRSLVSDYNCVQGQANVLPHDKPHSDSTTNSSSQISDSNDKPHSDLTDNNMICVPIYPLHDINDYSSSCELLQASSCRSLVSDYNCVQGQANVLPHDKPHIDSTKNSSSQISDFTDKPHSDLTDNIKKLHDINDSSSCRSLVSDYNCVQGQANVLPHDKPHSDSTTNSSSQISDSNDKPHSDLTDNNMICVPIYPLHDINDSSSCEQLQASSCRSLVSDYNCVQGQANVLPHDKPHSDSTTNSSSQISDSNDKPHSDLTDNNMICVPIYPLHDINDYSSSCELLQASSCRSLVSDYNCVQGQANLLPHDKPHSDSTKNSSSQISDPNTVISPLPYLPPNSFLVVVPADPSNVPVNDPSNTSPPVKIVCDPDFLISTPESTFSSDPDFPFKTPDSTFSNSENMSSGSEIKFTARKSLFNGNNTCHTSVEPSNKRKRRDDRKHYCIFCEKLVLNFRRHLINNHKHESIIAEYLALLESCPNESKDKRKKMLESLKLKGNHTYNQILLKQSSNINVNDILPVKRPPLNKSVNSSDFVTCSLCHGLFYRKHFFQHANSCKITTEEKESSTPDPETSTPDIDQDLEIENLGLISLSPSDELTINRRKAMLLKEYGIPFCAKSGEITPLMENNILKNLKKDEIGIKAMNDSLLLEVVSDYYSSHQAFKDRNQVTRKLRDGAKLVHEISILDNDVKQFKDIFDPNKLGVVIKACQKMCNLDIENINDDDTLKNVVVGMNGRLSWILEEGGKRLVDDIICNNSLTDEEKDKQKQKVINFQECLRRRWKYCISTNIEIARRRLKIFKDTVMPLDEDIRKFASLLRQKEIEYQKKLQQEITINSYEMLCKATICHILTLNRRRPFEATHSDINFYLKKKDDSDYYSPDVLKSFADEEKVSMNELKSYVVPAKGNEEIATILLTKTMEKSIDMIISCRKPLNIESSRYLFSRPGLKTPFDGSAVMREMKLLCPDLKKPNHLTATGLRHHVATVGHVKGPNFSSKLSKFMCHTQSVHDKNYVAPLSIVHRGVIGNYLAGLEGTSLTDKDVLKDITNNDNESLKTTSTKHTIPLTNTLTEEEEIDDPSYVMEEGYTSEDDDFFKSQKKTKPSKKIKDGKKRWSNEEKEAVVKYFADFIKCGKNPGLVKCRQFLEKSNLSTGRTPAQVNTFIDNVNKKKLKLPNSIIDTLLC